MPTKWTVLLFGIANSLPSCCIPGTVWPASCPELFLLSSPVFLPLALPVIFQAPCISSSKSLSLSHAAKCLCARRIRVQWWWRRKGSKALTLASCVSMRQRNILKQDKFLVRAAGNCRLNSPRRARTASVGCCLRVLCLYVCLCVCFYFKLPLHDKGGDFNLRDCQSARAMS